MENKNAEANLLSNKSSVSSHDPDFNIETVEEIINSQINNDHEDSEQKFAAPSNTRAKWCC